MRFITEAELRDAFASGTPQHYDVPKDARLTPAARQYLMDLRLYCTDGGTGFLQASPAACETASAAVMEKPEHMTHLTRTELVCKAHPRIVLRGKLDSLEGELLLVQTEAPAEFLTPLENAMQLIRRILAADVKGEQLADWRLDGMSPEQIHRASHHPEEFGFSGHIQLSVAQGRFAALLNRLRTQTRECELCAVLAYQHDDLIDRGDLVLALNRLSSYFYVLQLRAAQQRK